jgi:hypothetical protein
MSTMSPRVRVLVITGSMGAGKTTVLGEASDLLAASNVAHAAIDLDGLGVCHLPDAPTADLALANLAAVWRNYAAAGAGRLLIAEALESEAARERLRAAIPDADVVVCRLRVPLAVMQARVRVREAGLWQQRYVDRVAALEARLDAAGVEDFSIQAGDRGVTDVAREMLERTGWL